jgi:hypothetical protein
VEPKESTIKLFRFEDPRQDRICRKLLHLVGPGPAAFYRDACRLMATNPLFETTTHLVSHLLREIESALRDVLESVAKRTEHLTKKSGSHKTEILAILTALEIPEADPIAQAWLRLPGGENSYALHERAHRNALAPARIVDEDFHKFWNEMNAILDVVLEKFEVHYLVIFGFLDALLAKSTPGVDDVKQLRNHIPQNQVSLGYFFDKLPSLAWLEPLKAEGFFKHAPEPNRDDEKGTIGFPFWPESRYLARMAACASEAVIEVILQVPDTDNIRVYEDFVDAALRMPAALAAKLVSKAKKWIELPYQLLLPEKLGALVEYLAKGAQREASLDLARSLLEVLPDPRSTNKTDKEKPSRLPPEPRARFDAWDYQEILEKHMPELVAAAGEKALTLLCDLLDSAIRFSRRSEEDTGPEDYSFIWRPAIEDHEQNHPYGLRDFLVSAVRDAAEQIAKNNPSQVPALVEKLEQRRWHLFQRIALHLLRVFPDAAPTLVTERLLDQGLLDAVWCQNEYRHLLKERFDLLSPEERERWLGLIEEGPPANEEVPEAGEPLSPEDVEQEDLAWRRKRLAPVIDRLPSSWRSRHEEWVKDLTSPTDFSPVSTSFGSYGPTSPKSTTDLSLMSVKEIVTFLKTWQPSDGFSSPDREGLGRELTVLVTADPERFAVDAGQFQGLDPTYVRALPSGLRDAIKQQRSFSWRPVLELCCWVMTQPREIPGRKSEYSHLNPGWVWTRGAIADLLNAGFEIGPAAISFDLRALAWEVLKPITGDPQPTLEDEARHGGANMDPASLSLNTTRGKAMHAVIRYALWVRNHIEKASDGKERIERGFDEMPEVREVLEAHLDPERDPALAVRAVYGQWFPWLVLLDQEWATTHVSNIFPLDESLKDLREAAWETYIVFYEAYDNVFAVLRDEYGRAIERISTNSTKRRLPANSDECLAEHLMMLYWRGNLALDEPDGLLTRFYAKASDALCGHAFGREGRRLYDTKETIPSGILDRLKMLWAQRLTVARADPSPTSHAAELAAFAWWFASAKFDNAWALNQLTEVLKLVGKVDVDHKVVERLAALAADMPRQAVQCLRLMVEGDTEGWRVHAWREHTRTILAAAIQNTDTQTRQVAVDLVHRLGACGYFEFRDLLPETSSS